MLKEYERKDDGMTGEQRKAAIKEYRDDLADIQQEIKASGIPILVLIEGYASASKGALINKLISELDPRFASVFILKDRLAGREDYPFLYPYFNAIPENGKFVFMDSGWMEECVSLRAEGKLSREEMDARVREVNEFERQLKNNGYLVLKFFSNVSRKHQKKIQKRLRDDENTAWRVTAADLRQNDDYDTWQEAYDDFMEATGSVHPWHILNGEKKSEAFYDAFRIVHDAVKQAIAAGKYNGEPYEEQFDMPEVPPRLADADLSACLDEKTYKKELKALRRRLSWLQDRTYRKHIPVVLAFEGMDAAGKGGTIKRVAYPLDPRGYDIIPTASPEPHEKARHFLWRFWTKLPKKGRVAIFDRTWYGRVMVERLEGFCSENDWQRAYNEINEFERELTDWGAVVLKFWLQIDSDVQLQRFNDRQNTPGKQWKICDEDWRNREKWPQYEVAVSEMLEKTSTVSAPWHVIGSNDKKYARIKTMRIICDALEEALEKKDRE